MHNKQQHVRLVILVHVNGEKECENSLKTANAIVPINPNRSTGSDLWIFMAAPPCAFFTAGPDATDHFPRARISYTRIRIFAISCCIFSRVAHIFMTPSKLVSMKVASLKANLAWFVLKSYLIKRA